MSEMNMLLRISQMQSFVKDQVVFTQNEEGNVMYIVLEGVFGVYINTFTEFPLRITGISTGGFFGEMAVIDGSPRSATIISERNGKALVVNKENFRLLLESNVGITRRIMNSLTNRVVETREKVRSMGKTDPDIPMKINNSNTLGPKDNFSYMMTTVKRLRILDDIIGTEDKKIHIKIKDGSGYTTLLPKNHKRFAVRDPFNSSKFLVNRQFICPYCHFEFIGKIPLFSQLIEKERTLDQRIIYNGFDILWYRNSVCPNCTYCATYQEFTTRGQPSQNVIIKGSQFKNAENFTGFHYETMRTLDEVILSYYLSITCIKQVVSSQNQLQLGKAWQRLHWIYSDNGEKNLARESARHSLAYFNTYFNEIRARLTPDDRVMINAILGELNVAIGDIERAFEYFSTNVEMGKEIRHELIRKSAERLAGLKAASK